MNTRNAPLPSPAVGCKDLLVHKYPIRSYVRHLPLPCSIELLIVLHYFSHVVIVLHAPHRILKESMR